MYTFILGFIHLLNDIYFTFITTLKIYLIFLMFRTCNEVISLTLKKVKMTIKQFKTLTSGIVLR